MLTRTISRISQRSGLVPAGKFLVGFDMWLSETTGDVSFKAYFVEGNIRDKAIGNLLVTGPVDVIGVDVPLTVQHFLTCFKRFNVKMTRNRIVLESRGFFDE